MRCRVSRRAGYGRLRFLDRHDEGGDRLHVFFRHGGEIARDGQHRAGRGTVLAGAAAAQIGHELLLGPRLRRRAERIERGRFLAVHDTAVERVSQFFTADQIERRMTRRTVAEAIEQQLAAIPPGVLRRVRLLLAGMREQQVPESQQWLEVQRKDQLVGRRGRVDRLAWSAELRRSRGTPSLWRRLKGRCAPSARAAPDRPQAA